MLSLCATSKSQSSTCFQAEVVETSSIKWFACLLSWETWFNVCPESGYLFQVQVTGRGGIENGRNLHGLNRTSYHMTY